MDWTEASADFLNEIHNYSWFSHCSKQTRWISVTQTDVCNPSLVYLSPCWHTHEPAIRFPGIHWPLPLVAQNWNSNFCNFWSTNHWLIYTFIKNFIIIIEGVPLLDSHNKKQVGNEDGGSLGMTYNKNPCWIEDTAVIRSRPAACLKRWT